ncbi:hypothetical protein ACFX14_041749 [Malus domestica]|uniref:protein ORANGE, chloroplastic-like isoform X2 n=2 Tax=Malus domestica TaxID=3750 RepID=UPI0010AACA27|nr:protein ORANGE, chloroplastic-like isoform X1 [Malus domestica]XP_028961872.1 protein ORANGE, chloroplastic-like isoform X1 [Malus domestica]
MSLAALIQPDMAELVEAAARLYIICSEWGVNILDSICDGHVDCLEWLYMILFLIVGVSVLCPSIIFCIIEGPETVQDFATMELQEIQDNIRSRRNKIFLHMEEVRRLRIQQRIKRAELGAVNEDQENELPSFPSFIPFLPPLSSDNLKQYYAVCYSIIVGFILFGGLIAPSLELKLGIGGTSYKDFIVNMHLPLQLSQVDPIVASFSGGAVGVISALMVVEINNVKQQEHKRCKYCLGTGSLACARCSSTGTLVLTEPVSTADGGNQPLSLPKTERCSNCSGAGKVMCPTCLCTGMAMASEHDPRIDPFD